MTAPSTPKPQLPPANVQDIITPISPSTIATIAGSPAPQKGVDAARVYADVAGNAFGAILGASGVCLAFWWMISRLKLPELLGTWIGSTQVMATNTIVLGDQAKQLTAQTHALTDQVRALAAAADLTNDELRQASFALAQQAAELASLSRAVGNLEREYGHLRADVAVITTSCLIKPMPQIVRTEPAPWHPPQQSGLVAT